ncbi:MAG: hypothetical protein IPF41_17365 [Flavobacteriales bacterium]|nr:hypothetical protein [Flavobacteriales bacterium]
MRVLNAKLRFITLRPIDVEATRIICEAGVDRIDPKLARFNLRPGRRRPCWADNSAW